MPLVKDMSEEKKAERALRKRLAKERRYYGMIGRVESVEYADKDDEGYHHFFVKFDNRQAMSFCVKVYSHSYKVFQT